MNRQEAEALLHYHKAGYVILLNTEHVHKSDHKDKLFVTSIYQMCDDEGNIGFDSISVKGGTSEHYDFVSLSGYKLSQFHVYRSATIDVSSN